MSNTTITRNPDTIHSGDTYTSDPAIEQVDVIKVVEPTNSYNAPANDFTHVRDIRTVVTSGLAVIASGALVLGVLMLFASLPQVALISAFVGVAAGLIGVAIGRTRSFKSWGYQLAGYVAVASATLAVLLTAFNYISQNFAG